MFFFYILMLLFCFVVFKENNCVFFLYSFVVLDSPLLLWDRHGRTVLLVSFFFSFFRLRVLLGFREAASSNNEQQW